MNFRKQNFSHRIHSHSFSFVEWVLHRHRCIQSYFFNGLCHNPCTQTIKQFLCLSLTSPVYSFETSWLIHSHIVRHWVGPACAYTSMCDLFHDARPPSPSSNVVALGYWRQPARFALNVCARPRSAAISWPQTRPRERLINTTRDECAAIGVLYARSEYSPNVAQNILCVGRTSPWSRHRARKRSPSRVHWWILSARTQQFARSLSEHTHTHIYKELYGIRNSDVADDYNDGDVDDYCFCGSMECSRFDKRCSRRYPVGANMFEVRRCMQWWGVGGGCCRETKRVSGKLVWTILITPAYMPLNVWVC